MSTPWTLKIKFTSDWHVGEGAGQPGHIDHIVRRDPYDDLPYVPAKTVTGIWRDGCEQVARGLDGGKIEPGTSWSGWVEALFGDQPAEEQRSEQRPHIPPRSALLGIRAACFPEALRQRLKNRRLTAALTFVKPGIKIDRKTGQVEEKHLRFEERVRAGAVLEAKVFPENLSDEQGRIATALLWAGAKAVERLGGKRRRGAGHCVFQFEAIGRDEALALLEKDPSLPPPLPDRMQQQQFPEQPIVTGGTNWVQVPLVMELLSPVVVPHTMVGNVVECLDYIPGTHLLGPITRRLCKLEPNLFPYVARGDLIVTHAYPEVAGDRGLPVPLALFYKKEEGGLDMSKPVWNRLLTKTGEEQAAQLKQHREGYIGPYDGKTLPALTRANLQFTTHSTIEDQSQRPTEAVGGVFTYQALRAGSCLRAELRLRKSLADVLAAKAENWWQYLKSEVRLGKAKKDDYGRVRLSPMEPTEWKVEVPSGNGQLTVWLLSDLLLRDKGLRPATSATDLKYALENKELGATLTLQSGGDANRYLRTRRSDGWHQGWTLPRPSYVGLAAGSCLMFKVDGQIKTEILEELTAAGLGERRAEGFGQLAFNQPLISQPSTAAQESGQASDGDRQDNDAEPLPDWASKFLEDLERTAWREDLRRAAVIFASDDNRRRGLLGWQSAKPTSSQLGLYIGHYADRIVWQSAKPTSSQLGAWRQVLSRVVSVDKTDLQTQWLKDAMEAGKWTEEAFNAARDLLENTTQVWKLLCQDAGLDAFPALDDNRREVLEKELWAEAVRTLFAAAIHAEQRARERE